MSAQPENGGPAFPTENEHQSGPNTWHHEGMTLRDYFAGQAVAHVPAMIAAKGENPSSYNIAKHAYEVADAMIKHRASTQENNDA